MLDFTALFAPLAIFPLGLGALLFGLLLKGVDRIVAARLQRRVGPPLLQPFFDIIKLMRKQTMVPEGAPRGLFLALPAAGAGSMLLAAALIPIAGVYHPAAMLGDLLVLLYLLTIPAVVLMLAGSASGSVYGAIGFSREMALVLAYEGPLLLVLASVAMKTGMAQGGWVTFSLPEIVRYQQQHGAFLLDPWMWPAVATYLLFFPANLGIPPFDIPEAEAEVLEGPLLEYSGPALALFSMMSALKAVVVIGLGITLFFPIGPAGFAGVAVFMLKCLVLFILGKTLLRTAVGRMRIDQAFLFYLKWPELLGVISLVTVIVRA
ncbi:NADH-quinone oxidoreductase subunit H [Sodalis ligni]|jgi:formate hydrogenlyase subunit 4|uniref:NADH-quinone oxidoreductase subunit H n=1 Tax=Sodalis ligni TaxID=2697027 RepID=A0A4R1ND67_9GAMM|nr:complex I subunit 1 family protein [Sodalis ligni]QWA12905.1 NADH-quinone oxidoreductase subunit H [Sodalis ligni]TCL03561.1 NADH-quinone oxidoreductase subunit H [Sodalis ligni]